MEEEEQSWRNERTYIKTQYKATVSRQLEVSGPEQMSLNNPKIFDERAKDSNEERLFFLINVSETTVSPYTRQ